MFRYKVEEIKMFRSMRSDRFPRLYDYFDAVRHESKVKPFVKGKRKGEKPLAERSRGWLTIRKDEGSGDVVVRLYSTDIITYKQDGRIVVDQGGWNTPTTHEVLARVLGTQIYNRYGRGWVEAKGGSYILSASNPNVFMRSNDNSLIYVNPPVPTKHILKRKEYNNVRKRYESFVKYAVACTKLRGNAAFDVDEWRALKGVERATVLTDTDLFRNDDNFYEALLRVYYACPQPRWGTENSEDISISRVKSQIDEIIKHTHRDEIFESREVRDGRVVKDPNGKYF